MVKAVIFTRFSWSSLACYVHKGGLKPHLFVFTIVKGIPVYASSGQGLTCPACDSSLAPSLLCKSISVLFLLHKTKSSITMSKFVFVFILKVVNRGSETQLQVGEHLNCTTCALTVKSMVKSVLGIRCSSVKYSIAKYSQSSAIKCFHTAG